MIFLLIFHSNNYFLIIFNKKRKNKVIVMWYRYQHNKLKIKKLIRNFSLNYLLVNVFT